MSDPGDFKIRLLSRQAGAELHTDGNIVFKSGSRVHPGEEAAMKLVNTYKCAPAPDVVLSEYSDNYGSFAMPFVPGQTLRSVWDKFEPQKKKQICENIWNMILRWRQIPRPAKAPYQCLADGSSKTRDLLLKTLKEQPETLTSDSALRNRIYERYIYHNGRRYEKELPDMLPRSETSVFTHGDVAPHNILVDEHGDITAILDWEYAGWYPEYWEYANIMKPRVEEDWQEYMDATKPQNFQWNIEGIEAARRVLF